MSKITVCASEGTSLEIRTSRTIQGRRRNSRTYTCWRRSRQLIERRRSSKIQKLTKSVAFQKAIKMAMQRNEIWSRCPFLWMKFARGWCSSLDSMANVSAIPPPSGPPKHFYGRAYWWKKVWQVFCDKSFFIVCHNTPVTSPFQGF